ncbi:MAG: hypothetical protein HZA14_10555 [Nitrospirae bacterium]|nr:hypothetical protein [Nitrospirota bacterium]
MKLTPYLLGVLLIIMSAVSAGYAQTSPKDSSDSGSGRYQLFQGTYTSMDLRRQETSSHVGIFLLDTKTGKVKRYVSKIDEQGKYIETWLPTELTSEKEK